MVARYKLTSFWFSDLNDFVSYSLLVNDFIGGGIVVSSYDLDSETVLKQFKYKLDFI